MKRLRLWIGLNSGSVLGCNQTVKAERSHSPCLLNSSVGAQRPFWWGGIYFQIRIYSLILTRPRSSSYKFYCKVRKGLKEQHLLRLTGWGLDCPVLGSLPSPSTNTHALTHSENHVIAHRFHTSLFVLAKTYFPISHGWIFWDVTFLTISMVGLDNQNPNQCYYLCHTLPFPSFTGWLHNVKGFNKTVKNVFRAAGVHNSVEEPYPLIRNDTPKVIV